MKKLFILFALLLIPAFAHGADVTGPFEYKLQCVSHVSSTVTGTTAETTLGSCTIPGGAIGANGTVWFHYKFSNNNSGNNKTFRLKFGGAGLSATANTTNLSGTGMLSLSNRNSVSSQIAAASFAAPFGNQSGAFTTSTVDTSASQAVLFTCQLANATDTCVLEAYDVWIMRQ